MTKISASYLGDLRTQCKHLQSGKELITDAPTDNNGKGEAFSPTDLIAAAYVNCMITIIGIYCKNHNLEFKDCEAEIEKKMINNPRRIGSLDIQLTIKNVGWSDKDKAKIEKAAKDCPVAKSVSSELETNISFNYQ